MKNALRNFFAIVFLFMLTACGGGGGGGGGSGATGSAGGTLSGVAATGAPIVGRIYIKDANGVEHFVDTTDGTFSFSLSGLSAPYMLKAEWTVASVVHDLYSFADSSGHFNITPLTQMVVVAAAGTSSLSTVYASASPSSFSSISSALPGAVSDLQQTLQSLMTQYGVAGSNPMTMSFTPDHTGMDALLDSIDVSYASGNVLITDHSSGAMLVQAPATQLAQAVSVPAWTASDAAVASDIDVAVNAQGTGLVVWSELVSGHYYIRACFLSGSGSNTTLSTTGDSALPRVVFDGSGNAIVVWAQYSGSRNEIWSSRYIAGSSTWTIPVRISDPAAVSDAYVPDIAIDSSGNAIVSWHQGDGRVNHFDAWTAHFTAGGSWSTPVLVSDGVNSAYDVRVALNAAGQGLLAWEQEQGDGTTISNGPKDIWSRMTNSAGSMGSSHQISALNGASYTVYGQVAVAMNSAGGGAVLWVQSAPTLPFVIHAAVYASGSWQTSTVINSSVLDNSYGPRVAFDASGNAIAVWQQQTGYSAYGGTNRYVAGTGWGTATQFVDDTLGDLYDPRVAVDAAGNASAVWYRWNMSSGKLDVMLNQYLVGTGWGTAQVLSPTTTDGSTNYPVPRVATNSAGQTVAVWGVN